MDIEKYLIDVSDSPTMSLDISTKSDKSNESDKSDKTKKIILIQKENVSSDDPKIKRFIDFCIKTNIFDNTFYDYNNAFSIFATKLPAIFDTLSKNDIIKKNKFITMYKRKYKYRGDIEYVYDQIDKEKRGYITTDELLDFFLPFIKYTSF